MFSYKKFLPALLISVGLIAILSSCGKKAEAPKPKPIMPYKVMSVEKRSATLFSEYPTTIEGIFDIDIRTKVDGFIEEIYVDEGQEIRKGQLLFKISNPQYEQDIQNHTALVASAEAAIATAQLQIEKTKPLVNDKIISAYELKSAELNLRAKEAALLQAKALLNNAKINQGYTTISSPVNGVVGELPYKLGSYVNSNTPEPLTRITDISKVYAYFGINEKEQLDMMAKLPGRTFQEKINQLPAVTLMLSNGSLYEAKGKIETFSGQVNSKTGSFNVRAVFPNDGRLLRAGNSGKIRIPLDVKDVIIIPQKATAELQNKRMAYIVDDSSKIQALPIQVREIPGGKYFVVDEGLNTSQKLLIEGVGVILPGTAIKPVLVPADSVLNLGNR
jgi:membrane fusion protein (multidrug efflux system)